MLKTEGSGIFQPHCLLETFLFFSFFLSFFPFSATAQLNSIPKQFLSVPCQGESRNSDERPPKRNDPKFSLVLPLFFFGIIKVYFQLGGKGKERNIQRGLWVVGRRVTNTTSLTSIRTTSLFQLFPRSLAIFSISHTMFLD